MVTDQARTYFHTYELLSLLLGRPLETESGVLFSPNEKEPSKNSRYRFLPMKVAKILLPDGMDMRWMFPEQVTQNAIQDQLPFLTDAATRIDADPEQATNVIQTIIQKYGACHGIIPIDDWDEKKNAALDLVKRRHGEAISMRTLSQELLRQGNLSGSNKLRKQRIARQVARSLLKL